MNRKISRGGKIIIYLVLLLVAFVMVVPFAWMILTAFKTQSESTQMNPFLIFPTAFRTEAFVQAWEELTHSYAADRTAWNRSAVHNTAKSGYFSSDRTIREYDADIWHSGDSSAAR